MKLLLSLVLILLHFASAAQVQLPSYFHPSKKLNAALQAIVHEVGLDSAWNAGEDGTERVSLAVIDVSGRKPQFGGVNADNFIYPASVYKMYVAMEVLRQVSAGEYSLYAPYIVKTPNDVDRSKEIGWDPRPLLKNGDTVTIHYLLDLMLTRSDNTAANCLIDRATRKRINETMHHYHWHGSEVTRKFLRRSLEDPGYDSIRGTQTNALHAADFLYRMYTNQLVNPWVSRQLTTFLGRQLDTTKLSTGLPPSAVFYHKTGWWSIYTHDAGMVDDGHVKYVIALFTPVREEAVRPRLKLLAAKVHQLISSMH